MNCIQGAPDLRGSRVDGVREGFPEEPTDEIGVRKGIGVDWGRDWGQGTFQAEGRECSKALVFYRPS